MTETDVDQIIEIGSGFPTRRNVHQIARELRPNVRVVYVDNDPVVAAHGRALLSERPRVAVVQADVRDPASFLDHAEMTSVIDPSRPLAVLVSGVLHHLDDADDPAAVMRRLTTSLAPGTHVMVADVHDPGDEPRVSHVEKAALEALGSGWFRSTGEHERYFEGLDLVDPGLVFANDWRPDLFSPRNSTVHRLHLAGLARKP